MWNFQINLEICCISWEWFLVFQLFTHLLLFLKLLFSRKDWNPLLICGTGPIIFQLDLVTAVTPETKYACISEKWTLVDYLFNNNFIKSVELDASGGFCFCIWVFYRTGNSSFFLSNYMTQRNVILFLALVVQVIINAQAILLWLYGATTWKSY